MPDDADDPGPSGTDPTGPPIDRGEPPADASESADPGTGPVSGPGEGAVDDAPTISCTRCDREWTLSYELDALQVGNQAVEQFALDHKRHTGHFPDDISTWRAGCRHCPEAVDRLDEHAARRWAKTHARHTGHAVAIDHASLDETELVEDSEE